MPRKTPPDPLGAYRRKRSPERTPEPFTAGSAARPRLFVVQKHAARSLHFDLRLEMEGVLQSWAVPKGPSLDPAEKRLAVLVEEHPLEYADFEGLIPAGNYGAGAVIVWDRGRWEPVGDPREGLRSGKLLFDLYGYKLRGRWTLFRTKRKDTDWLLMKKPDGEAGADRTLPEQSIRSGLTVEQLRDGHDPAEAIRSELARRRLPRRGFTLDGFQPMLGRAREKPFSDPNWLFEIKYDGFRLLAEREEEKVRLRFRGGHDATRVLPEIADAIRALPFASFVLDGEVVVLDPTGKPSFQGLQQRVHLTRPLDISRATVDRAATMFVFDLPAFEDRDLRSLPLTQRKALLRRLLPPVGPLRFCDHIEARGEEMYEAVRGLGLEGMMAKRASSVYVAGRSDAWLKIRADRVGDFVVVGFSPPRRAREGFGALHLAAYEGDRLVYAGRVGTGFDSRQLVELQRVLAAEERSDPACGGALPRAAGQTWVEPRLVVEVRYKEWTRGGLLRQPVFLRERRDKGIEECMLPASSDAPDPASPVAPEPASPAADEPPERAAHVVSFTNLGKVFWPAEGYTKGDLIDYYRSVARWLLPYLEDRPVVLTRYPDGIAGKSFFQKDAPGFVPPWVRTQKMWSEHAQREIHYFVCDDEATLLYLINLGTIPLHLWSSRVSSLQSPDWSILDLDPKQAPFRDVVRVARTIRELCRNIGLPSFVKTSGSTGLHVLVPLDGRFSYEQSRTLAQLLARLAVAELPEIATLTRATRARGGRVYIDYLQNGHGRLLVAPFSVRPLPGAPVSTPLRWDDVRPSLDIRRYTIRSVPRRLRALGQDPFRGVLEASVDLEAVLERLARRLG